MSIDRLRPTPTAPEIEHPDISITAARRQMFLDFCALLEDKAITYVILSGYQGYPDQIDSDVDFMVSEADFARLPALFREADCIQGSQLVQVLQHETSACYYVVAKQIGAHIAFLHPDAAASYRRCGRLWLHSERVLATRRKSQNGFWIPAPSVEFEYYLVKRIDKELVESRHLRSLAQLMVEDKHACLSVLAQHFQPTNAIKIEQAINENNIEWFAQNRTMLRAALHRNIPVESLTARLGTRLANLHRRLHRIFQPTGLVIAVLGPDGSGKTTVIERLEKEIAPAFRRVKRIHLRPRFGKTSGNSAPVTDPHAQSPRGQIASALKILFFISDYWIGWLRLVYPAKVRSTLVIFDRYYHDMLVDSMRYRLPEGFFLPGLLARLVPKPDIWLILDAPAETLVARKGEITLQAAQNLTIKYRSLAAQLPDAISIHTGTSLEKTLVEVVSAVCGHLAHRTQRRLKGSV